MLPTCCLCMGERCWVLRFSCDMWPPSWLLRDLNVGGCGEDGNMAS